MAVFSLYYVAFVGIAVLLYYLAPKKYQWVILLVSSIMFYYLSGGLRAGIFITVTILSTFYGALAIDRIGEKARLTIKSSGTPLSREEKKAIRGKARVKKRRVFLLTLLINLGILIVLKYTGFFTTNLMSLFSRAGVPLQIPEVNFLLPLAHRRLQREIRGRSQPPQIRPVRLLVPADHPGTDQPARRSCA